ncbi:MAG: hypothetical protein ACO2ZM_04975 [Francisellaceae bacterium]
MDNNHTRKTLTLKVKREQNAEEKKSVSIDKRHQHHAKPKSHHKHPKAPHRESQQNALDFLSAEDGRLRHLIELRGHLLEQINQMERRLIFTASEPMQAACSELKKKDVKLLCQINNHLISR